jgi:hypothetical protein
VTPEPAHAAAALEATPAGSTSGRPRGRWPARRMLFLCSV